ncbi:MAG TPA: hypothetical protein VGV38_23220 [Pyrinomonadaceae bacterium]|nr:hypothetical protein [Pyrinomonadaceae bacterium]
MPTDPRLLVSTSDLFEWLWPATFAASALASAWALARSLRRGWPLYAALPLALAALAFPLFILPLFISALLLFPTRKENQTDQAPADDEDGRAALDAPDGGTSEQHGSHQTPRRLDFRRPAPRRALTLAYVVLVLSLGALHLRRDYHTADAHLARAANAKLRNQRERAVEEYTRALAVNDDPHTRKLLALELSASGRHAEALAHLRAARDGGEPDEFLPFHVAAELDALGRPAEAAADYRAFLDDDACRQELPDPRCDTARTRLRAAEENFSR